MKLPVQCIPRIEARTPNPSPHPDTMRVLNLLTAALLPFTSLAAKKPTGDRFTEYHSKQLSAGGSVKLTDKTYDEITKAPRDYSVAVLLTALEARFGCGLCNEFQPEWDMLSKQWAKGDKQGEGRLVFGTLDFLDGKQTFQSVCSDHVYEGDGAKLMAWCSCNSRPRQSCSSSTQQPDQTPKQTTRPLASTFLPGMLCPQHLTSHRRLLTTVSQNQQSRTDPLLALPPTPLYPPPILLPAHQLSQNRRHHHRRPRSDNLLHRRRPLRPTHPAEP